MKNPFLLYTVIACMAIHSFAQDQRLVDSLQTALKKSKQDTIRVNILNELALAYQDANEDDEAKDYANQSLSLSKQIGFKKGIGNSYYIMGYIYQTNGDSTALEYYNKALQIRLEIGDKKSIANTYAMIGSTYQDQSNYPEAQKHFSDALKIRLEIGDKKGLSGSYTNLGMNYYYMGNYPESMKYYYAGIKIDEEIGNKRGIASKYVNIGNIYSSQKNYPEALKSYFAALKMCEETGYKRGIAIAYNNVGLVYFEQSNYPEALKSYRKALEIFKETGNKNGIAGSTMNIGIIYKEQGNYPEALINHFAALKIHEEINDKFSVVQSYVNIGNTYTNMKKFNEARKYLNDALSRLKDLGTKVGFQECYSGLSELDSVTGNYKSALEHYKLSIIYRDSLVNEENTKKLQQLEFQKKFKTDSIQQEEVKLKVEIAHKEQMNSQRIQKVILFSVIAVVLVMIVGIWRRLQYTRKAKVEIEKAKADIEKAKAVIEKEKDRSEELLLNILPYEVAEELKSTGAAKAKTFSMVSVMFTDFKDFTSVSEKVSAELLVDEIHYCFSAFDAILQKYKIEKIKTIGDAYMCASGLPVLNYTHAEDLVNAAFEIRDFMAARKKEKESRREIPFELRIGIHTGPVVAGIVGVKKFQYDIWGDTVNLAARMESSGEAGKVNISGSTYQLVKDQFACTYRGKIQAKHKGEIDMYFVEAL